MPKSDNQKLKILYILDYLQRNSHEDSPVRAAQLIAMLDELRTKYDLSIFLSTHDFATLGSFADKVILLNKRVMKKGTPDEVLSSPEFYDTFHLRMGKGGEA